MDPAAGDDATAKVRQKVDEMRRMRDDDVSEYGPAAISASTVTGANPPADKTKMVRAASAVTYRHFSTAYIDDEAEARAADRGIWQGAFEEPWR